MSNGKVITMLPNCTFFFGVVKEIRSVGKTVVISNGYAEYVVSSSDDKGLSYVPIGKKRLVVISHGKILAVYIRPRMRLIGLLHGEMAPRQEVLLGFRPIYPTGFSHHAKR